jgi:adenylate cyclase class 2
VTEFEAKFFVNDLEHVRQRIRQLGGQISSERQLERNWGFDLPDRSLSISGVVLRLREDSGAHLTYKRPLQSVEERYEIELDVDSAEAARELLENLGYQVVSLYEKYREVFLYGETHLMLDELPFGEFVEIEGPSLKSVETHARKLGLRWARRVRRSYLDLYDVIRSQLELSSSEATFQVFGHLPEIDPDLFELEDAITEFELES